MLGFTGIAQRSRPLNTQSERTPKSADIAPVLPPEDAHAGEALEALIMGVLEDDKAEDILSIDLRGKSSVTDFMMIASGRSHRHVGAIADHVLRKLKEAGTGKARAEGLETADWVLIDAGDVVCTSSGRKCAASTIWNACGRWNRRKARAASRTCACTSSRPAD